MTQGDLCRGRETDAQTHIHLDRHRERQSEFQETQEVIETHPERHVQSKRHRETRYPRGTPTATETSGDLKRACGPSGASLVDSNTASSLRTGG